MRWTWISVIVFLAACGGNENAGKSKDALGKDAADVAANELTAVDGNADNGGVLDLPGDSAEVILDVVPEALAKDVVELFPDDTNETTESSDSTDIWLDWLQEDTALPLGCGSAIIEDEEVCDRGSMLCKNMLMNFISGIAYCKEDCTGWSTAGCITNGIPYCGNGIKEGLEGCDGTPKPCKDLGTGWKEGTAVCSFDCKTFDIADCKTDVAVYGYLDVAFSTTFIMNDNSITDPEYVTAHPEAFIAQPTFVGQYAMSAKPIPNPLAQATVSYALRDTQKDWLYILQESVSKTPEGAVTYQNPQIEMHFGYPDLVPGDYPINFLVMGATRLYLFQYKGDGTKCLLAVGIGGSIKVTQAQNTGDDEGGQLSFEAQQVPVYYVSESPYGQALANSFGGMPLCEKE